MMKALQNQHVLRYERWQFRVLRSLVLLLRQKFVANPQLRHN